MKKLTTAARLLLGIAFVVFGLNGFLNFLPQPKTPPPPGAMTYMTAFAGTYLAKLTMGTQLVSGLLLVSNLFVPLALLFLAPVIVNIILFHLTLMPATIGPGLVVLILELYLAWAYRGSFTGVLAARAEPVP